MPHVVPADVAPGLQSTGSLAVVHRLCGSKTCGSFLDQELSYVPCIGRRVLNHRTTREVPFYSNIPEDQLRFPPVKERPGRRLNRPSCTKPHMRMPTLSRSPPPRRLLCPWDSPGKNPGSGCHALLQGIFPAEGSNQVSCIAGSSLLSEPPGKLHMLAPYFL